MIDGALAGKLQVVGISGSTVAPSKTRAAVEAALDFARDAHCEVSSELIGLSDWRLDFCDGRDPSLYSASTRAVLDTVSSADALIVGSPIYRGSYPGALKNLFDLLPVDAVQGKVVGLIATGGSPHHFLAIEHQLKPLMGFFRAHVVPVIVYAQDAHFDNGTLVDREIIARLLELAIEVVETARRLPRIAAAAEAVRAA
jgi:MsuE subfamily FMN reductase